MKKLSIFVIALVLATSAFTYAGPAAASSTQDVVTMVKKGAHKTKRGSRVLYHRTKVGGKWVYKKGKVGGKTGYHKVKQGGKWVYHKAH